MNELLEYVVTNIELKNIIISLFAIIYLLFAYSFRHKRAGEQVLPWVLLIICQYISVLKFVVFKDFIEGFSCFSGLSAKSLLFVTIAILTLINILLILFVSLLFKDDQKKTMPSKSQKAKFEKSAQPQKSRLEKTENKNDQTPGDEESKEDSVGSFVFGDDTFQKANNNEANNQIIIANNEQPSKPVIDDVPEEPLSPTISISNSPEPDEASAAELDVNDESEESDKTMESIKNLIDTGRKDEAIKYLRMLAFLGENSESRATAEKYLKELEQG